MRTSPTIPMSPAAEGLLEGPVARWIGWLADTLWSPRPAVRLVLTAGLVATQLAIAALVLATGGTQHSALHLMYVIIAASAFLYGTGGGLVAGVTAGLLVGPFTALDVDEALRQPTATWVFRLLLFTFTGVIIGAAASLLRVRLARSERLQASLSQTYSRNLRLFAGMVAQRDEGTSGHCERVAENAVAIGRRLGLAEDDLNQLYWSGLLHDLGKIGVPEAILRKPGPLTEEEFAVMRHHARLGRDILVSVSDAFGQIGAGVYSHHEKWDGTGYPRRLVGSEIPLFGRIIAVADVFEAVTSERPYRRPMPVEEALQVLAEGSGTHFDPEVLRVFQAAFAEGDIRLQNEKSTSYDTFLGALMAHEGDGFKMPISAS